jgi:PBP1b-binding outer membrane lipoprotein LpoB
LFRFSLSPKMGNQSITMKKIICILASAALLGACEQRTEVAPAAPAEKKESNTTIVNPPASTEKTKEKTTITNAPPADGAVETKSETKTETTSSSPNP